MPQLAKQTILLRLLPDGNPGLVRPNDGLISPRATSATPAPQPRVGVLRNGLPAPFLKHGEGVSGPGSRRRVACSAKSSIPAGVDVTEVYVCPHRRSDNCLRIKPNPFFLQQAGRDHDIDLVEQQLRVAGGEPLPFLQRQIDMDGHAIECRINAENPEQGFRPCPGTVVRYGEPFSNGARMDTHLYSGYSIPPHYDSLLGKLIVHKASRAETIPAMLKALDECVIEGLTTTIPFHKKLFEDRRFREGYGHTKFVEEEFLVQEPPA